jgi:hypothetical protein
MVLRSLKAYNPQTYRYQARKGIVLSLAQRARSNCLNNKGCMHLITNDFGSGLNSIRDLAACRRCFLLKLVSLLLSACLKIYLSPDNKLLCLSFRGLDGKISDCCNKAFG